MAGGPVSPAGPVKPFDPTNGKGSAGALIAAYAHAAGFSGSALVTAVAIAKAESGWNARAKGGPNSNGTYDWGLFQINDIHKPNQSEKTEPLANARKAFSIYKAAGSSFRPWATYGSGAYKSHMIEAAAAVAELQKLGPDWERAAVKAQAIADDRGLSKVDGITVTQQDPLGDLGKAIAGPFNALNAQFAKIAGNAMGITLAVVFLVVGIILIMRPALTNGAAGVIKKVI